ncbi:MAG: MBL fold metallo-hydrolase [Arenicellales bacterium]|jgi:glyoxylase-like metal-dependent hydrolase (beta-lactamase superfamily II)
MNALLLSCLLILFSINSYADYLSSMKATPVADNVYAILTPARDIPNPENLGWNSNSAFVVTKTGVLVIDTGSSETIGNALKQTIRQVTDKPVKWIVNSHAHGDHWLGNIAFKDSNPVIYATSTVNDLTKSEGATWVENFKRLSEGATGDTPLLLPNKIIDERSELLLDETKIVLFPSGNSHSPGDLITWLPQQRVVISGDVVYSDRMPTTSASDITQWITMLDELQALDPAAVIPGHGDVTDVEGLRRLHALLSGIRDEVQKGYEAGLSDYEMLPAVVENLQQFEEYYPGFKDKLGRDISHVYLQIEAAEFQ